MFHLNIPCTCKHRFPLQRIRLLLQLSAFFRFISFAAKCCALEMFKYAFGMQFSQLPCPPSLLWQSSIAIETPLQMHKIQKNKNKNKNIHKMQEKI